MFCQSVMASVIFYAAACWEDSIRKHGCKEAGQSSEESWQIGHTAGGTGTEKHQYWMIIRTAIRFLNSHTNRTWVMSDTQVSFGIKKVILILINANVLAGNPMFTSWTMKWNLTFKQSKNEQIRKPASLNLLFWIQVVITSVPSSFLFISTFLFVFFPHTDQIFSQNK